MCWLAGATLPVGRCSAVGTQLWPVVQDVGVVAGRIASAALALLGSAVLLLPSAISTATACGPSGACLTELSWRSPSFTAVLGSSVFAAVVYVFVSGRLTRYGNR